MISYFSRNFIFFFFIIAMVVARLNVRLHVWNKSGSSKGPALPAAMLLPLPSAVTINRKSPGISGLHHGFVMPE